MPIKAKDVTDFYPELIKFLEQAVDGGDMLVVRRGQGLVWVNKFSEATRLLKKETKQLLREVKPYAAI